MQPDGSGERILSQGFLVEGATFCPNGRVLMFYRQTPLASGHSFAPGDDRHRRFQRAPGRHPDLRDRPRPGGRCCPEGKEEPLL